MPSSVTPQALTAAQASELETASRLLQAGKAGEAVAIATQLLAKAPRAPDAHHLLALCHAEAEHSEQAEQSFVQALELVPDHPLVLLNYATLLRKTGRLDAALAVLRRATDAAPDSAKAWSELGVTALRAGQHDQAQAALKRAVALQPGSVLDWHALGNASRASGDLEAAEAAFRTVTALSPGHPSALINLGAVLRMSGRPDEAVACYEQVRKRGYQGPELADALVGALLDDGRLEDALQLARQVARQHPDFVPALVTLANLLWEYGPGAAFNDDVFELFRGAIQEQPHNPALRWAYIQFLLSARAGEEALEQTTIARQQEDDPMLAWMQANAFEMLGRTQAAGNLYAELHRQWGRGVPAFLNAYARHLLRAGQWDVAARTASEATLLDSGNQEAWACLGTAWRLLGDPREHWLCDYERLVGLVDIETPPGFTDQARFLEALEATLHRRHTARREPIQQSLRGGSQTPGRLFGRRDPVLAAARTALLQGVERWLGTLPTDATHPFLMRKTRSVRIDGSWSVKLWTSGSHVNHIHPEGWISSAFYVALPPSVASPTGSGQAGHIQFGQPPQELQLGLQPQRVIRPEPGKLALFPSYLWHGTVPFEDEQPRITLAFDMTPLANHR